MAYSTQTIAKGCFGKIYKQKYNDTWAAIKKVPQHLIDKKDLERECDVYNKSEHPNIVKLLGNITLTKGLWIIPLEFIFGEDLETTIFKSSRSKIKLTTENKATIIVGMCEGLYYLHCKDIVHQDLKPDNIMVEHDTNRAVIIDLGLAKFFRCGLNSAIDMGNEAYAAPEVLRRGIQRDQRSDVWAMGKIIAELCARVRLPTPSVSPEKIKETLKDQPYCNAVCRMVDPNPSLRASMGGVIHDIRLAGGKGIVVNTPVKKDHLNPPSPNINAMNRSPSPIDRGVTRFNRDPSPMRRAPPPINRDPSPMRRSPLPMHRASPPINKDPTPIRGSPLLMHRGFPHFNRDPSPMRRSPSPLHRASPPNNKDSPPRQGSPSPLQWDRTPRPDLKPLTPKAGLPPSPSLHSAEDKNRNQALVPTGGQDITHDFMKMQLYKEAVKDLPCNLPTTGKVVVRCFENKDGDGGKWVQKEIVTQGGKIVKYNDVSFNMN